MVWLGQFPALGADPMSEDERLELLGAITEAHAALSEAAFKLRRADFTSVDGEAQLRFEEKVDARG